MKRKVLLLAAMALGMLLAGGLGREEPFVAQAQSQERQAATQTRGAPGGTDARGVSMRPAARDSQMPAAQQQAVEPPPLGLTERGKAAIEQARRSDALPTGKQIIQAPEEEPSESQPDAPALGGSFLGVADTGWLPPDPQIAAGPNNVVVATNGAVNVYDKDGFLRSSQSLAGPGGFFSDAAVGSENSGAFDPWVVYDPYINRFWILAVSRGGIEINNSRFSHILIGLSNTSDATLGWTLWELDARLNGATATPFWCDYPKLGFDAQAIYVTCNMFSFPNVLGQQRFQYTKTRVMTKRQFVSNTGIFWWDFWDLREGDVATNRAVFTMQPAQMLGASAFDGEFLLDAQGGGGTGSTFDVWRITNAAECCNGDNIGPTINHRSHAVGSYGPSDGARQSGSATQINNGDSRLLYAFWQGGRLSTGQNIACGVGGADACVSFTELNVTSFPTISTINDWAYTTSGVDYYYPSVAPNASGNKTMVLSRSGSSEFASARYVGIPSSFTCTFCTDGEVVLEDGGNTYVNVDGSNRNRWGDYSGASPDPNGRGVWVAGEFAATAANTWGVQVGLTHQDSPPEPNDNFFRSRTISGPDASAAGSTRFATREPFEPDHLPGSVSPGEHTLWHSWTAPHSGSFTVDTCFSRFDTVLAVYRGTTLPLLTLGRIRSDDDSCTTPDNEAGSRLSFNAVAGTTYRIAVGGFCGSCEGAFALFVTDTQPPGIERVVPGENATGIAPATNVNAFFSEPMRARTINGTTFKLFRAGTTNAIGAAVAYDAANRKAVLNPNANLRPGTRYEAVVTTGATDVVGNQLDQNPNVAGNQQKTWSFTIRR